MLKVAIGLIINPSKTLVEIKSQKGYLPGIILGVIATLSFPLISLIARILMDISNYTDVIKTLLAAPIFGISLFVLYITFLYLLSRLFKGEGKWLSLASNMGWASIPVIFVAITLGFLVLGNTLMQAYPGYKSALLLIAVICAFLVIAAFMWSIKTAVISISVSMNLSLIRSIVVFIISSIICLIPFEYLTQALS